MVNFQIKENTLQIISIPLPTKSDIRRIALKQYDVWRCRIQQALDNEEYFHVNNIYLLIPACPHTRFAFFSHLNILLNWLYVLWDENIVHCPLVSHSFMSLSGSKSVLGESFTTWHKNNLNLEGHQNCRTGSRVMAILLKKWIFPIGQSGEASRWTVCYQRGLPRLVYFVNQDYKTYMMCKMLCTVQWRVVLSKEA